jgi:hypothetical protein
MYENHDERIDMGNSAKQRVNEEFSLDAYAQRMVKTVHSILNGNHEMVSDETFI